MIMTDLKESIAQKFYRIDNWGDNYFYVNAEGHVSVKTDRTGEIDLYHLVQSLNQREIEPPIIIRFNGILRDRIHRLKSAFSSAIYEFKYNNEFKNVYPIKSNPQRHIVDLINKEESNSTIGLEVGSKPELLAALMISDNPEGYIFCNGYKDIEFIEIALFAKKLGKKVLIIIENVYELKLILDISKKLEVTVDLGLRFKPTNQGTGHWIAGGENFDKFGLNSYEITLCLDQLREVNAVSWVKLLHFHMGSQITTIDSIIRVFNEAACIYVELARECPSLCFFDVGGGIGIDYDGSKTASDSSINYSVEEYARDVVSTIGEACKLANVPDPIIISESGRALVAHHAVLIIEAMDVTTSYHSKEINESFSDSHELIQNLYSLYQKISPENCLESLHDALELRELILEYFVHRSITLHERAHAEQLYKRIIAKICNEAKKLSEIPSEIEKINKTLFDIYFCNFSVFQSLIDSWAIEQVFPIMPIHRLLEIPNKSAIIADLTCDSDGKINKFIGHKGSYNPFLSLHELNSAPYYLGVFLVGAYQEILGGLHNLFGDAHVVHVDINKEGNIEIDHIIEGDTNDKVLSYTQYNPLQLFENLKSLIEKAIRAGHLTNQESALIQKKIKQSLESYTYLVI